MTKVDEILLLLRKRTPLKEIHRKYKSSSQFYDAMVIFEPEADEDIERRQRQLSSLSTKIIDLKEQNKSLNGTHNQLKMWNTKAEKTKVQLQLKLENLRKVIEENRGELDGINSQLKELTNRGITKNFLTRILDVESESGEKLLEKVRTAKDHLQLQKELTTLNKQKTRVEEDIIDLKKKSNKLKTKIQTQRNLLDEAELKTQTFKEAVTITRSFFSGGYNTTNLKNLKTGLDLLAVKGDHVLSINRLVTGLEDAKTLTNLKAQIEEKEKECNTLKANINSAKGELNAFQKTVLKTLNKVKDQVIKEIKNTNKIVMSEANIIRGTAVKSIEMISSSHISRLKKFSDEEAELFEQHRIQLNNILKNVDKDRDEVFKNIGSMVKATENTVKEIMNRAATTGEMVRKLESLAPILRFIEKAEGEPSEVLSTMRHICNRFKTWIGKQPKYEYYSISTSLDNLITYIDFEMKRK